MNEPMNYLVECIKNNKRYSAKKLKSFNDYYNVQEAYEIVHGEKKCEICGNKSKFINTRKGFAKYCSQECYNNVLSSKNKTNNSFKNKERSNKIKEERIEILEKAKNHYLNSSLTISQTAKLFEIPKSYFRKYISENDVKKKRNYQNQKVSKRNDDITNYELRKNIDEYLENKKWVNERLKENWSLDHFASFFSCSRTFIGRILKERDIITCNVFSNEELIVRNFLFENNIEFFSNVKSIIPRKELDIYIPKFNLAIEINGIYWHSEKFKNKNYHLEKTLLCEDRGISLMHFFDNEIRFKRKIVFSILQNHFQKNKRIFARKCSIRQLSFSEKNYFFLENHISGDIPSSIAYGLFHEEECVAAMSFGKPRFNSNYDFELLRFCNKRNLNVVGGANRLFKHFLQKNKYSKIISYSQRRLFSGNIYKNLEFSFSHYSEPNYFWANKDTFEIYSRYQCQKHKLKTTKTENEYMQDLGFMKIWDCGNSVWVYN